MTSKVTSEGLILNSFRLKKSSKKQLCKRFNSENSMLEVS